MNKQTDMFSFIKPIINETPDKKIPEGVKLKRGQLYCPYCSSISIFKRDSKLGVRKCPYCGISDRDYNVKKVNKIWK